MTDSESQKRCNEATDRVACESIPSTGGNFVTRIPCAGDKHEGRRDRSLGYAQEKSHGYESSIVVASCCDSYDSPPEESVDRKIFRDGKSGNEIGSRVLPEEISEVEYTRYPRVLLTYEAL